MKNWKKGLMITALAAVMATLPVLANDRIDISVTGGKEDSMVLDTAAAKSMLSFSACRHLYEGLYKIGPEGEPVLGQAESVEISDDGLVWTFTLRDDITWSDGKKVSAYDFTEGWQHVKEYMEGPFRSMAEAGGITIDAPDEKTFVINLVFPCDFLPEILAFVPTYPIRMDYVEKYGEDYATDPGKAVYNGPFELTKWDHDEELVMERRDDYYDSKSVDVEKITWKLNYNEAQALEAFEQGELTYSDLYPVKDRVRMEGAGMYYAPGDNNYCVMFNMGENGNDVLKDVRVRKALSLAIDREHIIEERNQHDQMGSNYMCPGAVNEEGVDYTDFAPDLLDTDNYDKNCDEARALLAEAGYPDGKGFPNLIYIVNTEARKEVAEMVTYDWEKQLGIDTIDVYKVSNFFDARESGDYDIAYFGWFMDYHDLSNMYLSLATMQTYDAFWSNDEYVTELMTAASAPTLEEAWGHYAECERIIGEEVPVAVLLHSLDSYLFDDTYYDGLIFRGGNYIFTYLHEKEN